MRIEATNIFYNFKIVNPEPLVNSWYCSKGHANKGTSLYCKKCLYRYF